MSRSQSFFSSWVQCVGDMYCWLLMPMDTMTVLGVWEGWPELRCFLWSEVMVEPG